MPIFKSKQKEKKKGLRQRSGCTFLVVVLVLFVFIILVLAIKGTIIEKPIILPARLLYATSSFDVFSVAMDGSDRQHLSLDKSIVSAARFEFGEAANGKVVFQQLPLNISYIYMMDQDGTNLRALTDNSGSAMLPSLSPDGQHIAYEWLPDNGNPASINVINADGSNIRKVATLTDSILGRTPHWFPDSQHIVFTTGDQRQHSAYQVDMDGEALRKFPLPEDVNQRAWGLRISPDGQKVAFAAFENGAYALYTANIDGSNVRSLGDTVIQPGNYIVWTSDSNQLLYLRQAYFPDEKGYDVDGIWLTNLDGTQKRQVIPDRTILAFTLLPQS